MSRYLAAYDVTSTRQRERIARILGEYGARLQLSVFEVDLEPAEIADLQLRVGVLLDTSDRFDLLPVDPDPRRARLCWHASPEAGGGVAFA